MPAQEDGLAGLAKEGPANSFQQEPIPELLGQAGNGQANTAPCVPHPSAVQNLRSRTGEVRHGAKRSSRGSIPLASQQLEEGFGSRSQGSSMPSDSRRPRTRLNLQQRRILVQAFERNPLPGFATREQLGQRTGLNEDTIHIWFQNRRARQARAPDQDVPASQVQDVATGGLSGRDKRLLSIIY